MIQKVMIFDGTTYLDVEWIAAVYEAPGTDDMPWRAVRLKSGQVHNSQGTPAELIQLMQDACARATAAEEGIVFTMPNLRFPTPGRPAGD
jgi:hypothetical protein